METPSGDRTALNDFRSFKPMYTLQPVKATREKQLKQWSNIIMKFCRDNKVSSINPADFSLFKNPTIDRNLSPEAVTAVVESMIKAGKHLKTIETNRLPSYLPFHDLSFIQYRGSMVWNIICIFYVICIS
jgi:ESCRT-II complex subunit